MYWRTPDGERTITRFLLLPRTIDGITKWLEVVRIKQKKGLNVINGTMYEEVWVDVSWA